MYACGSCKYLDHRPLYRVQQELGRHGVEVTRSTLADWVSAAAWAGSCKVAGGRAEADPDGDDGEPSRVAAGELEACRGLRSSGRKASLRTGHSATSTKDGNHVLHRTLTEHQSPPEHYRNQWLIDGMIRMRMIDQVGSGIRRMFEMQRGRFLPLPDYSFDASDSGLPRVEVTISGQVLDAKYTQTLMRRSDLELRQVVLLDRVQKGAALTKAEASELRRLGLIEGRFPRVFVSARVAAATGGQAQHIRKRGFDNRYYRDLLVELIREHGPIGPAVITELFLDKLPDSLSEDQKRAKIRNLTFDLAHRRGVIENVGQPRGPGALWRLREADQAKPAARPIIQDQK